MRLRGQHIIETLRTDALAVTVVIQVSAVADEIFCLSHKPPTVIVQPGVSGGRGMASRRLPRDAELLHAIQQRRASEAEARRGAMPPSDDPLGVLQNSEDVLAFDLFEGPRAGRRS